MRPHCICNIGNIAITYFQQIDLLLNLHRPTYRLLQILVDKALKVFVLWLRNKHYYTHDVKGIKMAYRDLPYYEGTYQGQNKHAVI